MPPKPVPIDTAERARERDAGAIASGISSLALMQQAGRAAATIIAHRFANSRGSGVEVHTGPGNNGGDGWIVAAELTRMSVPVRVREAIPPRSADAIAAKDLAGREAFLAFDGEPSIWVDALLGTGCTGAPRGEIAAGLVEIARAKKSGAEIIALDIPTGLDATTGEGLAAIPAAMTLAFGAMKRGHLISRAVCGELSVLDIGLGPFGDPSGADCTLADSDWVSSRVPPFLADAHKGTRKRLAIIAGDVGMAGAAILAAKAALRSGIGLLHLIVARENRDAVHSAVPAALVSTHEELLVDSVGTLAKADAIVIGPGLHENTAAKCLSALPTSKIPLVVDAGALTALATDSSNVGKLFAGREVVFTPHPAEMGRLISASTADVLSQRFDVGLKFAREIGATVLLKGTPTIVTGSDSRRMASASGTPALATGGSGDLLSGIVGTLVAQTGNGFDSAVCGAWVHGRAAELCGPSRGVTLEDILFAMPAAWKMRPPSISAPVLALLPAVQ